MTDAISRSEVINVLQKLVDMETCGNTVSDIGFGLSMAIGRLISAPALDVEPVVHATWIEDGYRGIPCVCAHCGEEAHYTSTFREQFDYDWEENLVPCGYEEIREYIRSNHCPNCGARMDGEE